MKFKRDFYVRIKNTDKHNRVRHYGFYIWRGVLIGIGVNKGVEENNKHTERLRDD